jgi:hypothetical protein
MLRCVIADNVCSTKETPPSAVLGNNLLKKAYVSLRLSQWKFHGSAGHRLQNFFCSNPAFNVMARDSEASRRLGPGNDDIFGGFQSG